jgi:hypothetical protein
MKSTASRGQFFSPWLAGPFDHYSRRQQRIQSKEEGSTYSRLIVLSYKNAQADRDTECRQHERERERERKRGWEREVSEVELTRIKYPVSQNGQNTIFFSTFHYVRLFAKRHKVKITLKKACVYPGSDRPTAAIQSGSSLLDMCSMSFSLGFGRERKREKEKERERERERERARGCNKVIGVKRVPTKQEEEKTRKEMNRR